MSKKVAIYRESFNLPGRRHRLVAEALCKEFDEVVVTPWHRLPGETIKYDIPLGIPCHHDRPDLSKPSKG